MIAVSCVCASLIVYLCPWLRDWLVYDRQAILDGELWRLGTACFVHFSPTHLLWDGLVLGAAGWIVRARGHRGFSVVCCLSAVVPGIYLLLAAPRLEHYGGLSGLATGAVAYLCLCEISRAEGDRTLWVAILVLTLAKIVVETAAPAPIFAGTGEVGFDVLPSAHAIGCLASFAVHTLRTPNAWRQAPGRVERLKPARVSGTARARGEDEDR